MVCIEAEFYGRFEHWKDHYTILIGAKPNKPMIQYSWEAVDCSWDGVSTLSDDRNLSAQSYHQTSCSTNQSFKELSFLNLQAIFSLSPQDIHSCSQPMYNLRWS